VTTSLLLEGEDLEALLVRAHQEGGANARIVRAEKVRQGGFLGFFARERFEVAVEIPELSDPRPEAQPRGTAGAGDEGQRSSQPAAAPGSAQDRLLALVDRASAQERRTGTPESPTAPAEAREGRLAARGNTDAGDSADARDSADPRGTAPGNGARDDRSSALRRQVARLFDDPSLTGSARPPAVGTLGEDDDHAPERPEFTALLDRLQSAGDAAQTSSGLRTTPSTQNPAAVSPMLAFGGPTASVPLPRTSTTTSTTRSAVSVPPRSKADALAGSLAGSPASSSSVPRPSRSAGTPAVERAVPAERRTGLPRQRSGEGTAGGAPGRVASVFESAPRRSLSAPHPPARTSTPRPAPTGRGLPGTAAGRSPMRQATVSTTVRGDMRTASDRRRLRSLGIPAAWTRQLRGGDRFASVLHMLERMPDVDADPDAAVVAVVGPPGVALLEAHRTAVELAVGNSPRPVIAVPTTAIGGSKGSAIALVHQEPCVVAVEIPRNGSSTELREVLQAVDAKVVVACVDGGEPVERTQNWIDSLDQVDAVVVNGTTGAREPMCVLQLGLPVVRLDGIPLDRVTWAALLCARLEAMEPAL
jgi:hypothetical protein